MSKKAKPSFELRTIIWDIAATVGKDNPTDIQRQLDIELEKRRKAGTIFDDAPDVRTISRIVKEINKLDREVVVAKLPPHVWKLRDDYEVVKRLADLLEFSCPFKVKLSGRFVCLSGNGPLAPMR